MSNNLQTDSPSGWTVPIHGKMSESRFRTVRQPGEETVSSSRNATQITGEEMVAELHEALGWLWRLA